MGAVTGLPQPMASGGPVQHFGLGGMSVSNVGSGLVGSALGGLTMGPGGTLAGGASGLMGQIPTNLGQGIGAMTGSAGGAGGTGFTAPQQANIQSPVTQDQINTAQGGVGNSLASQQALINALGGGAGNLQSAYGHGNDAFTGLAGLNGIGTMGQATQGTGGLAGQLGSAGGIGAQTGAIGGLQNVLAQQQGLAGQYGDIAAGRGPNPAQAMLNNATGQNVANQGALMAGQRGAGANVGLMARQAAQQGAATQQQAAGQGAAMQANQQMNALSGLGAQQQAMAGTNAQIAGVGQGLTGQQMTALNQLYGQGAGTTGMQQNQIGMNAGIAQNQVGNQMGATNQFAQNNLANAGQTMGAGTAFNQAQVSGQGSVNAGNAGLAQTGMQGNQALIGGIMNKAGLPLAALAGGGEVAGAQQTGGMPAQSSFGQFLQSYGQAPSVPDGSPKGPPRVKFANSSNPPVPTGAGTNVTPGGYAGPDTTASPASGAGFADAGALVAASGGEADMRSGGHVAAGPGQKAEKAGDSYANDKIPAVLSEKEIVLPRTVTLSNNAPEAAARFVAALQAKQGKGRKMMANAGDPAFAPEAAAPDAALPPDASSPAMPEAAPPPPPTGGGPLAGEVSVKAAAPMRIPRMVAPTGADLVGEAKAQMQDVANGIIKPMTYKDEADRLAEHNTLGKFGVIAGMLLSGAGAGLTHSDSAMLNMMDKEIQKDYDAKVKTNENLRNQFELGLKAQTANANNALTQAQVTQTEHETKGQQLINANTTGALMKTVLMMQKLGMSKEAILRTQAGNPAALQAMEQAWQMKVQPYFEQKAAEHLQKAGAVNQLIQAAHTDRSATNQQPQTAAKMKASKLSADHPVDDTSLAKLADDWKLNSSTPGGEIPGFGAMDKGDIDEMTKKEAPEIKQFFQTQKHVYDTFEKLDRSPLAGKALLSARSALMSEISPILAKYAGSNSDKERENVIKALPEEGDLPSVRREKAQILHGVFERVYPALGPTMRRYETRGHKLIADILPPPHVAEGREAAPEQQLEQKAEGMATGVAKAAANTIGLEQASSKPPTDAKIGDEWTSSKGTKYRYAGDGWHKVKK